MKKAALNLDIPALTATAVAQRKEQLITHLKVKLIAKYPGCPFEVGDIITVRQKTNTSRLTNQDGLHTVFLHDEDCRVYDGQVEDYPQIFKMLD